MQESPSVAEHRCPKCGIVTGNFDTCDDCTNGLDRRYARDQFAVAALTGLLANRNSSGSPETAETAYKMADAMLKEREKKK